MAKPIQLTFIDGQNGHMWRYSVNGHSFFTYEERNGYPVSGSDIFIINGKKIIVTKKDFEEYCKTISKPYYMSGSEAGSFVANAFQNYLCKLYSQ